MPLGNYSHGTYELTHYDVTRDELAKWLCRGMGFGPEAVATLSAKLDEVLNAAVDLKDADDRSARRRWS